MNNPKEEQIIHKKLVNYAYYSLLIFGTNFIMFSGFFLLLIELQYILLCNKKINRLNNVRKIFQEAKQSTNQLIIELDTHIKQQFQSRTKGSALYALYQLINKTFILKKNIKTKWRPPKQYRNLKKSEVLEIRSKNYIQTQGKEIPPPITTFKDMRFPQKIINILLKKNYRIPTPIQMQAIPIILSGRDLIGISITGTGKTLSFILPCIIQALQEQLKLPIIFKQGPFSVIITPSHQLAIQISECIKQFFQQLIIQGYPKLSLMICIGGYGIKEQLQQIKNGVHIIVATPGRLSHMLDKKQFNLRMCKTLVMDEADRLLDLGFQMEMKKIVENINIPYQTLLFCTSMPPKTLYLTQNVLYNPITIIIKQDQQKFALNVLQQFEYLKQQQKTFALMEALKKTDPKVIIFCQNKNQCDNLHLYLNLKGLQATCLHGGKNQQERSNALKQFQQMKKDILVATDVAAKGLQFTNVKHIINYDMPKDIQSYKQRVARVRKLQKIGRSTTFITKNQDIDTLAELKQLLIQCNQKVPNFLKFLNTKQINKKMEIQKLIKNN